MFTPPVKALSLQKNQEKNKLITKINRLELFWERPKRWQIYPGREIMLLIHIYNDILGLVDKPGKEWNDVIASTHISLMSIISKWLENLVLLITWDLPPENWRPDRYLGLRQKHSTLQKIHRITLRNKQYCRVFVAKVWYLELIYQTGHQPTSTFQNHTWARKVNDEKFDHFPINPRVPQGSVLGPLLRAVHV